MQQNYIPDSINHDCPLVCITRVRKLFRNKRLAGEKKSERENKGVGSIYPYRKCYFYLDRKYSQKNDQILVANQPSRGVDCGDWVRDFFGLFQ